MLNIKFRIYNYPEDLDRLLMVIEDAYKKRTGVITKMSRTYGSNSKVAYCSVLMEKDEYNSDALSESIQESTERYPDTTYEIKSANAIKIG